MNEPLTGQDIHAAFVHANNEENKPPLIECIEKWEKIGERSRELYTRMAAWLTKQREVASEDQFYQD